VSFGCGILAVGLRRYEVEVNDFNTISLFIGGSSGRNFKKPFVEVAGIRREPGADWAPADEVATDAAVYFLGSG
jgi:hypothetical protein